MKNNTEKKIYSAPTIERQGHVATLTLDGGKSSKSLKSVKDICFVPNVS